MRKTYKYRLLGNKTTFSKADEWLLLCQKLYNIALEQRISIYRYNSKTISCYDQSKQLPELKEAFPEYQSVGAQVLQDVIQVTRLPTLWTNSYFAATVGGAPLAIFKQCVENRKYV